jgi:cAMP-dependent protein kinase regulator
MASGVGNLDIADGTRDYIVQKLNPLLVELVQVLVRQTPPDTDQFILNWLYCIKNNGKKDLVVENAKLSGELEKLKKMNEHYSTLAVTMLGDDAAGKKAEDDDEEEDDDDDYVDEIPEFVPKKPGMRQSVSAEAYGEWNQKKEFTPPHYPKTDEQKARLTATLKQGFMFKALSEKDFEVCVGAMEEVNAKAGDIMITKGDQGDFMYIIEAGSLDCLIPIDGEDKVVKTVVPGDVFGELALLYNCPRAATVKAKDDGKYWKLDRESFSNIVQDAAMKKRDKFMATLKKVPILAGLGDYELAQIADAATTNEHAADEVIIKQGDSGNTFYIVAEGTAKAVRDGNTVMQYKEGDFFGELALLHDAPRAASIVTTSAGITLSLERKAFTRLLGSLSELRSQQYS